VKETVGKRITEQHNEGIELPTSLAKVTLRGLYTGMVTVRVCLTVDTKHSCKTLRITTQVLMTKW